MAVAVERDEVERPFIEQLKAMGWQHVHGPDLKGESRAWHDVLLTERLAKALKRINLHSGSPWMTDANAARAIAELGGAAIGDRGLLGANFAATDTLLHGAQIPGHPSLHGDDDTHVQYIDWRIDDGPELVAGRNDFLVVDQLEVRTSGGEKSVLDLVLFVNDIPLAVVECKNPHGSDPLGLAIRDLRAYTGEPLDYDERERRDVPCGVPELFTTVQLLIAATGDTAHLGTISSAEEHFAAWRSIAPEEEGTLRRELRQAKILDPTPEGEAPAPLTEQQKLIGVVLRPANLLNIVRHYVLALPLKDGSAVKAVCRHQQYRAVEKAVRKLRTGRTRLDPGPDMDGRGGVIWHTQGSGKSLTMAFLARRLHMHKDPALNLFTIVVITDRTQLQDQLAAAVRISGSEVEVGETQSEVEGLLRGGGRRVVFAMIQKYGAGGRLTFAKDADGNADGDDRDLAAEPRARVAGAKGGPDTATRPRFPRCNDSTRILILIDEAHRSHTSVLHACLREAVPNAARIGFSGTPIMRGRLEDTGRIFGIEPDGRFLDEYRMDEAERDGVVVQVRYEGRTGEGRVRDGAALDRKFDDLVRRRSPQEQAALARRWNRPTERDVAESVPMIRAKAADILEHYVTSVLPGGFKAQVAAVSRDAVVRYRFALRDARDELLLRVEEFDPWALRGRVPERLERDELLLLRAWQYRNVLRRIDFVPVISAGAERKERRWLEWTDATRQAKHIERFLEDFPQLPPDNPWAAAGPAAPVVAASPSQPTGLPWSSPPMGRTGAVRRDDEAAQPIAFLIVKSMLLTGFDAPIEQVLYLDRPIRDAELLQAVARVNRPAPGKAGGYVVDYYGVFENLAETLADYRDDAPILCSVPDIGSEVPAMRDAAKEVRSFLARMGIDDAERPGDIAEALFAFHDEGDRHAFDELLGDFLRAVERVLPHEDALDHIPDARKWAWLQKRLRRHYRDAPGGTFTLRGYGRKVRAMIAEHLELPEIEQVIPPVSITSAAFDDAVREIREPRVAAAEMRHALRFHLEERVKREDPAKFTALSKALEDVLRDLHGRFEEQCERLHELIAEARREEAKDPRMAGLSVVEQRVYSQLEDRLASHPAFDQPDAELLRRLSTGACEVIAEAFAKVTYLGRNENLHSLTADIFTRLFEEGLMPKDADFAPLQELSHSLAGFAGSNRSSFTRWRPAQ
jgi:type I restriction enzyme R subunit